MNEAFIQGVNCELVIKMVSFSFGIILIDFAFNQLMSVHRLHQKLDTFQFKFSTF